MNENIALSLLKPFIPKLKGYLSKGDKEFQKYVKSLPVQEDETHIVAFTEIDDDVTYIVIGAFRDKTFVRKIEVVPFVDWISTLLQNSLKNGDAK